MCAERRIQVAFALHRALRDLIQMPTHPGHVQDHFALVDCSVARRTQGEQVLQRILPSLFTKNDVMGFQAHSLLAAVLAGVAVTHQAGNAQVFIEPRPVLVLAAHKAWIIQTRNVHLDILYDDSTDRKRDVFDDADHLLGIRFDGGRQAPAALARKHG